MLFVWAGTSNVLNRSRRLATPQTSTAVPAISNRLVTMYDRIDSLPAWHLPPQDHGSPRGVVAAVSYRFDVLSTREMASVIWLVIASGWMMTSPGLRSSFVQLFRTFAQRRILVAFLGFYVYIVGVIWAAAWIRLWSVSVVKDTVVWLLIGGFTVLFASMKAGEPHYFRRALVAAFGANVILQLFFNVVTFSLWVELVLQPVLLLLIGIEVVAATDEKYAPARKLASGLLALLGIALATATVWELWDQRASLDGSEVLRSIALAIWLPLASLPYVYILGLYGDYEMAFIHIRLRRDDNRVPLRTKAAILLGLNFHISDVHLFRSGHSYETAHAATFREALTAVRASRQRIRDAAVASD